MSARAPHRALRRALNALAVCSGLGVLLMRTLPVGFVLEPHAEGRVVAVQVHRDGSEHRSEAQPTTLGRVAFPIRTNSRHFRFEFEPSSEPYRVRALTIHGLPLFNANWLYERVNPSRRLYDLPSLPRGESLPFHVTHAASEVDYVRFFDALLALGRIATRGGWALLVLAVVFRCVLLAAERSPATVSRLASRAQRVGSHVPARRLFVAGLVGVVLLTLPVPVLPMSPGLDPSWIWLVNHLAFTRAMGVSAVFTYGPLGFVWYPQAVGWNVQFALLLNLVGQFLWAGLLLHLYDRPGVDRRGPWLLLACFAIPTRSLEWQWTLLPILLMASAVLHPALSRRARRVFSALAGALLVLLAMVKFSALVTVGASAGVALVWLALFFRRRAREVVLPFAAAFALATLVAVLTLFASPGAAATWLRDSLEVAAGYNHSMLVSKSPGELLAPYAYLLLSLGYLLGARRVPLEARLRCLVFAPLYFVLTKYATTRQDMLPMLFAVPATIAFLRTVADRDLRARYDRVFAAQLAGAWIVAALLLPTGLVHSQSLVALSPANLRATLQLPASLREARRTSQTLLADATLPPAWVEQLTAQSVQSLPYEYAYFARYPFRMVPLYAFQGYTAYTRRLDTQCASLYRSTAAPRYLLCDWFALEGRNMVLESPALWSEVRAMYRGIDRTDRVLLLERRATPREDVPPPAPLRTVVRPNEWVDVDGWPSRRVAVAWPHRLAGTLCALFLRNDSTYLTVEYADGEERTVRILPDTLRSPFDLDGIPRDREDLASLFEDHPAPRMRAKRLRFHSNQGAWFRGPITLTH